MEASPFFAGWEHCPSCAGSLEIDGRSAECRACGRTVYANPAATASALVLDEEGRVLLARRAGDPGGGMWDVPGGFIEEGEDPLQTLRRELQEETGLDIEPKAFLGGFPDRYGEGGIHTLNLYWTAEIVSGKPSPADDVADLAWFAPDELPAEEEFAFRNSVEALEEWRGRVRSAAAPE
jgi:ADP-ribose pyrophosphatase YjhB (NUDIX family)